MIPNHTLSTWMVAGQGIMLLATIIWLPLRLPPATSAHPWLSLAMYAGGSLAAWTLLCLAWLELNYAMMLDVIAIGPPAFCLMVWFVGTLVYGIRMNFVKSRERKAQNPHTQPIAGKPASG